MTKFSASDARDPITQNGGCLGVQRRVSVSRVSVFRDRTEPRRTSPRSSDYNQRREMLEQFRIAEQESFVELRIYQSRHFFLTALTTLSSNFYYIFDRKTSMEVARKHVITDAHGYLQFSESSSVGAGLLRKQ
ncbi:hypothetical protein EVAR_99316_1 [Eumeta japonica]|uniref:Uncharacterized protein n=1 Tax=Eumeta variegata TaxID=151549 RepID=A0A4C1YXV0_EUMVA|nr:hypothetical protein EVAR_99316_1 [Eumeta japonica]